MVNRKSKNNDLFLKLERQSNSVIVLKGFIIFYLLEIDFYTSPLQTESKLKTKENFVFIEA